MTKFLETPYRVDAGYATQRDIAASDLYGLGLGDESIIEPLLTTPADAQVTYFCVDLSELVQETPAESVDYLKPPVTTLVKAWLQTRMLISDDDAAVTCAALARVLRNEAFARFQRHFGTFTYVRSAMPTVADS
jgi:hypothetical protein